MPPAESPLPEPPSLLLVTPLVTALSIIISMLLTLLALHFLLKKLISRNTQTPPQTNDTQNGVDQHILDSLPVYCYNKNHKFFQRECCVCLSGYEDGVLVRILPACQHVFHCHCIDAWFASRTSCPVCRADVKASESVVVEVDVMEEGLDETVMARGWGHGRSSSLVWPSDCRSMSFGEKLRLKRFASVELIL